MGTIVSTIKVGQKPTKEERKQMKVEIKAAKKLPPVYDPECPPSTPEALAEFAAMARERKKNKHNPLPIVALRIQPEVLAKYKALGRGYSGIMADVLAAAADNPEILSKARS
ncbi:MAG: BrnA antitoxin family protein [Treponema sp.]|nr:BrnA antitoxin family protein [Treponema sp.]